MGPASGLRGGELPPATGLGDSAEGLAGPREEVDRHAASVASFSTCDFSGYTLKPDNQGSVDFKSRRRFARDVLTLRARLVAELLYSGVSEACRQQFV